jgi:hypothetical protein
VWTSISLKDSAASQAGWSPILWSVPHASSLLAYCWPMRWSQKKSLTSEAQHDGLTHTHMGAPYHIRENPHGKRQHISETLDCDLPMM